MVCITDAAPTFQLAYRNAVTAPISVGANAAAIQTALLALSTYVRCSADLFAFAAVQLPTHCTDVAEWGLSRGCLSATCVISCALLKHVGCAGCWSASRWCCVLCCCVQARISDRVHDGDQHDRVCSLAWLKYILLVFHCPPPATSPARELTPVPQLGSLLLLPRVVLFS